MKVFQQGLHFTMKHGLCTTMYNHTQSVHILKVDSTSLVAQGKTFINSSVLVSLFPHMKKSTADKCSL